MDRCAVLAAGLIALALIGCGSSADPSGAPGDGDGDGDGDRWIDEGVSLVDGGTDAGEDGGEHGDADVPDDAGDTDAEADSGDGEADAGDDAGDGSPEPCVSDLDLDGVCDADDLCAEHDDSLDADADGVPDGCDTCPVGTWRNCEAVIWELELPEDDEHGSLTDVTRYQFGFVLTSDSEQLAFPVDMETDGMRYSYQLDSEDTETVQAFFGRHGSFDGHVRMDAYRASTIVTFNADPEAAPFDPRDVVLSGIYVAGEIDPDGDGWVRITFRGYVSSM